MEAQRSRNVLRSSVFRMVFAALQNRAIEKRSRREGDALSEEDILEALAKEAKKRKEAIALFTQGSRMELAEKERAELAVLLEYLPTPLSPEELTAIIHEVVGSHADSGTSPANLPAGGRPLRPSASEASGASQANFGKMMGEVMKRVKGRAEALEVNRLLKNALTKQG